MATAVIKAGATTPQKTTTLTTVTDKASAIVTVEGLYSDLDDADPEDYVPSGYTLESSTLSPDGSGMAKLTVNCVKYSTESTFSPVRSTFRIEMQETQYELADHPKFTPANRIVIQRWLATDESRRSIPGSNGNISFNAIGPDGELESLDDDDVISFCTAYMAGIRNFVRYFPVIEKISVYSNPPGVTASGRSFSSGSPVFSEGIGEYDDPPITLSGYDSGHWFKSKDSWSENADTTWNRVEQWTYTPESSDGDNSWIYEDLV